MRPATLILAGVAVSAFLSTAAIRPILDLPAERQISWIRKRLARFAGMLRDDRYGNAHEAADLHDEIKALAA